MTRHRASTRIR